jgi:hypothetical protein
MPQDGGMGTPIAVIRFRYFLDIRVAPENVDYAGTIFSYFLVSV